MSSRAAGACLAAAAALGSLGLAGAEQGLPELEAAVRADLQETCAPGAAVAVVRDGQVAFAKGYGLASVEESAPVDPDTVFQIGSVTKTLTAAAAGLLAEEGRLDLQAPVGSYLDRLSPRLARLTLHQLLSQTSGLRDQPGDYGSQDESALAASARAFSDADVLVEPGRTFSYSNPGFALAGAVLESATRRPFGDLMHERVFEPLGMARTTLRPTRAMTYPLAVGHDAAGGAPAVVRPLANDTRLWPAGYAYSTALDLSRFARALLGHGILEGRRVLPAGVVQRMTSPHATVPHIFAEGRYGYGLFIHRDRGLTVLEHEGTMPGFSAVLRLVPERQAAVIVLANEGHARLWRTLEKAMDLLGAPAPETPGGWAEGSPVGRDDARSLLGVYANRWTVELLERDGRLVLKQGEEELPVRHLHGDRYVDYIHLALWAFARRPEGPAPSGR